MEFSDYVEGRTDAAGTLDGSEILAASKNGSSVRFTTQDLVDEVAGGVGAVASVNGQTGVVVIDVTTREFDRAWSAELLFDKNEIDYLSHELTGDVEFTVAASGHLTNQFATAVQTIITDGTHAISFTGFDYIYGITTGEIPESGRYQIFFMYRNGISTAHWAEPSSEAANLIALSSPANFSFVPDATNGDSELDGSWDAVTNAVNYELQYSVSGGGGPWIALAMPTVLTYDHSGLTMNTTYHYRIRAIGDGVIYGVSNWIVVAATTEDDSDVTAPTFTFLPLNAAADWTVNEPITITADEPIRNTDGSELTDANIAAVLALKQTNSAGADILFIATIDATKTIVRVRPITTYGDNQLVYVAINNVEDVNGNEVTVAQSITFTTTAYTFFDGSSNRLSFGNILGSFFDDANVNFWLEVTIEDQLLLGARRLWNKGAGGTSNTFFFYYSGTDVIFSYSTPPVGPLAPVRFIKWTNVLTPGEKTLVLKYDGSIDTNDGLDRAILEIDGVIQGSKSLVGSVGTLVDTLSNTTAYLAFGVALNSGGAPIESNYYSGHAKDLIIRSNAGSVVEINVPVIAEGADISGNGRNGTWV